MTSKQRMLTALKNEIPDRLPVTTHHLMGSFLRKYMGGASAQEFFDRFGLDSIRWVVAHRPAVGALLHVDPYVWYPLVHGVLLAAFIAAPLMGLALASLLSQALAGAAGQTEVLQNFTTFGYAIIPLAMAGHIAHGLFRLLTRSRTVPFAFLAIVGRFPGSFHAAWFPNSTVFHVEMAVLALGAVGSLYACYRIARRQARRAPWAALPHVLLLLALLAVNVYAVSTMLHEMG